MKVKYSRFFRYSGRTPTLGELLLFRVTEFFCQKNSVSRKRNSCPGNTSTLSGKINRPRLVNVFGILACLSWFRFDFYRCYSLFELKVLISMNMSNSAVYLPSRRQCRRKTPVLPPFPLYIHRLSSTKPRQSSRRTMPWRLIIGENQRSSSVPQGSPQQPSKSSR